MQQNDQLQNGQLLNDQCNKTTNEKETHNATNAKTTKV